MRLVQSRRQPCHLHAHAHVQVRVQVLRASRIRWLLAWLLGLSGLWSSAAKAQVDLTGTWRAGATAIEVSIESWGTDCGTRPTSTRSNGGGVVSVEQQDRVLLLHGRDQDIRSDTCWSRNPAMKRSAASYSDGMWMTRCRTVANDPRAELGIYTLTIQDADTLLYKDVSHYDWALNESKCVATFTTTQTLTRVESAEGAAEQAPRRDEAERSGETTAVATTQAAQPEGCRPGAAASISLRPKQAEIEVGEKVCFKARVADASDCVLPSPNVTWHLSHSKALRGTLNGPCFTAADTAAEAEGAFRVTAKSGAAEAEAVVEVKRMDLSALIARRMEGPGLTGLEELEPVDTSPKAVARIATHTAPAEPQSSRKGWVVGLGVLALGLIAVGFWMSRRELSPQGAGGGKAQRAKTREPSNPRSRSANDEQAAETWICPSCRVGYPAQQTTCPKDGTKLVPYTEFAAQQKRDQQSHEKRCPKCGKTYPATAAFCGEDGTSLVPPPR